MATEPFEPFSFDFSNDASNEKIEASAVPKESDDLLVPENSGASFSLTEGESSVGKFTFSTDNPFSSTSIQKSEEKTQQGGKSKRKSGSEQTSFEDALAGEVSDDDLPTLEHREEPPILESIIKVPKPGESVKFDFGGFAESNASGSSFSAQESNIPSSSTEINFQTSSSGLPFQPFSFSESQPQSSSVQDDKPDDAIKSSSSFSFSECNNPFSSTAPPPTEKETQQRHQQHQQESEDDVVFDTSAGDQFRFADLLQAAGANDFDLMNNVDQIDVEQILGHFKDELVAIGDDDESQDPNSQQFPDFDDSQLEQFASSMGMGNFGVPSSGASGGGSDEVLYGNLYDRPRRRVVRGKRTGKAINSQDYNKLLEEMQSWGGLEDDEDGQNGDNDEEEEDDNVDDDGMAVDSGFVADVSDNESDELEDADDDNEDEDDNDVLPELEWEENDPSAEEAQRNRRDKQQKKTSSTENEDDT